MGSAGRAPVLWWLRLWPVAGLGGGGVDSLHSDHADWEEREAGSTDAPRAESGALSLCTESSPIWIDLDFPKEAVGAGATGSEIAPGGAGGASGVVGKGFCFQLLCPDPSAAMRASKDHPGFLGCLPKSEQQPRH